MRATAHQDHEPVESEAPEVAAATELSRRAEQLRSIIAWPCVTLGALTGFAGYAVVRQLSLDTLGVNVPIVTAGVAFLPPVAAMIFVARVASRVLIRRRARTWVPEIAQRFGVARHELADIVSFWD